MGESVRLVGQDRPSMGTHGKSAEPEPGSRIYSRMGITT